MDIGFEQLQFFWDIVQDFIKSFIQDLNIGSGSKEFGFSSESVFIETSQSDLILTLQCGLLSQSL